MSDRAYIGVLVAIAALVVGGLLVWRPGPPRADEEDESDAVEREQQRPTVRSPAPAARDEDPDQVALSSPRAPHAAGRTDAGETAAGVAVATPDAGVDAAPAWADPVNARVLGPTQWMAPDDEAEEARIDEVFERARAARHDPRISVRARATSIEAVREVVDRCFDTLRDRNPAASGRIIVAWRAEAAAGVGVIREPRVTHNVGLRDPLFESCVADGARDRQFGPAEGDTIDVEAPFFYDGSF